MSNKTFPIVLEDHRHIEPWHLSPISMTQYAWRKTYISITDYTDDGVLDYTSSEIYRVRNKQGNQIFACKPEDDDEEDEFPGVYWR